jgi:hypothetical protein
LGADGGVGDVISGEDKELVEFAERERGLEGAGEKDGAETVNERRRIFEKTDKASSRRAMAWSLDGRNSSEAGTICNTVERFEDLDWAARISARARTIN